MIFENRKLALTFLIVSLFSNASLSQKNRETKAIKGILNHPSLEVSNIHITNLNRKEHTISNNSGIFEAEVTINDILSIKGINFIEETVIISSEIYNKGFLEIKLIEKINLLKEVVVTKHKLTGDLGHDLSTIPILKKRTNGELGLPAVVENPHEKIVPFHKVFNLGNPFKEGIAASIPSIRIEPLLKHINGYYKNLKKKRKWDGESQLADDVIFYYKKEFISNSYNIDTEKIIPFIYYCIFNDDEFKSNFEHQNHTLILETFEKQSKTFLKE